MRKIVVRLTYYSLQNVLNQVFVRCLVSAFIVTNNEWGCVISESYYFMHSILVIEKSRPYQSAYLILRPRFLSLVIFFIIFHTLCNFLRYQRK